MSTIKTIRGPGGLVVELDATQIFPDNPGNGTPAMVFKFARTGARREGRAPITFSATYWCAAGEGELDGFPLTEAECRWLDSIEDEVGDWLEAETRRIEAQQK